ncbi:hypothetical protein Dip510_001348 [Elusimicrobium posterum]|uniref:hypothetical protein n=1 Tax=Elusimicrobium posterum TaxID=3116653 RepID=UPI003C70D0CC
MYYLSNFTLFVILALLKSTDRELKMWTSPLDPDTKNLLGELHHLQMQGKCFKDTFPDIGLTIEHNQENKYSSCELSLKLSEKNGLLEYLLLYIALYEMGLLVINTDDYEHNDRLPSNFCSYEGTFDSIYDTLEKDIALYGNTINIRLDDYANPALRIMEWLFISSTKDYLKINEVAFVRDTETKKILRERERVLRLAEELGKKEKDNPRLDVPPLKLEADILKSAHKIIVNVTFLRSPKEIMDLQDCISYGSIRFYEKQNVASYKDKRWLFAEHGFTYHMLKTLLERAGEPVSIDTLFDSVIIKAGKNPKGMPARKGGPTSKYKKEKVVGWHKEINRELGLSKYGKHDVEIKLLKDDIVLRLKT